MANGPESVSTPRFDLPVVDDSTQPYWDGLAKGVLRLKRCGDCGRAHFYPRPFCPHCWSEQVHWEDASGRGVVYTFSVIRANDLPPFGPRVPYVAAVVELAEGPRVMTNLVDCEVDAVRIGLPVVLAPREVDGLRLAYFRPASVDDRPPDPEASGPTPAGG
ncbi:MAG: Zn-ribbon domain-containing OB-fold protein [Acidimicrobiales bacterium]